MDLLENSRRRSALRSRLLAWYDKNSRPLPWRSTSDPYRIWVSEIMLQQTQVSKVIPYYNRFIRTFPAINKLARADLSAVLKAWEGMGYYARARHLHRASQIIIKEYHGIFPEDKDQVQNLPGIGPYTAAAILSIAFGRPYPVLDGNVNRVLCRVFRITQLPKSTQGKRLLEDIASALISEKRPGDYNQALMELGATICTPQSVKCTLCPIARFCEANQQGEQSLFPAKSVARHRPHFIVAAGIIRHKGQILIARRPEKGLLGGLWEFPGGKVREHETLEVAVAREIKEELDVTVAVKNRIDQIDHQYTHFTITLHVFECRYVSGEPKALGCSEWRWIKPHQLSDYAFPRANGKIIEKLFKHEITEK